MRAVRVSVNGEPMRFEDLKLMPPLLQSLADCGYAEPAADAIQRRCPEHNDLLWPKAQVRQLRFHDLRHTTAQRGLGSGKS